MLVGVADAGKTTMLTRLLTSASIRTVTSMEPNDVTIQVDKKTVTLVDLPGFDRLRLKYFEDLKASARAVIFVLDSLSFVSNNRHVADFLYTVLSDPLVSKRRLPILVACNKQDEAKAKSAKVLQKQLEKEVHAIRETRAAALASTDREGDAVLVGDMSREFQWSDVGSRIEFVDCSCRSDGGLEDVRTWLSRV